MMLPSINNCVVQYLTIAVLNKASTDCKTKSIIYKHRDTKPTYWKTFIQMTYVATIPIYG